MRTLSTAWGGQRRLCPAAAAGLRGVPQLAAKASDGLQHQPSKGCGAPGLPTASRPLARRCPAGRTFPALGPGLVPFRHVCSGDSRPASPSPHIPSLRVAGSLAARSRGLPAGLRCTASAPPAVCRAHSCPWSAVRTAVPSPPRGLGVPWLPARPDSVAQPSCQAPRQPGPAVPPAAVQSAVSGCGPSLGSSSKPDVMPSTGQHLLPCAEPARLPCTWAAWPRCLGTPTSVRLLGQPCQGPSGPAPRTESPGTSSNL